MWVFIVFGGWKSFGLVVFRLKIDGEGLFNIVFNVLFVFSFMGKLLYEYKKWVIIYLRVKDVMEIVSDLFFMNCIFLFFDIM